MNLLIGIDDTDNLESRGTGYIVRQLANWRAENHLAAPGGITRHQLLVASRIPYTSHNSSACVSVELACILNVWDAGCEYLLRAGAAGPDVGLCSAQPEQVSALVMDFGRRAKQEVLTAAQAEQIASDLRIRLAAFILTALGFLGSMQRGQEF